MKYQLLVLDIDGTLVNSQKKISPATLEALLQLQQSGVRLAIASGRPAQGIHPLAEILKMERFGGFIFAYNGGRIIECSTGTIMDDTTYSPETFQRVCDVIRDYRGALLTHRHDALYTNDGQDEWVRLEARVNHMKINAVSDLRKTVTWPVNKCILTGPGEYLASIEAEVRGRLPELNVFRSEPFFLEINPPDVDKGRALERFLPKMNMTRECVVCCGDGFNDISMIRFAGLGVAMANAQEAVKQAADWITDSNDQDGLAPVVQKIIQENNA